MIANTFKITATQASLYYMPAFLDEKEAKSIEMTLMKSIDWKADDIKVFGKIYPQPRLTYLMGEEGLSYQYSTIKMQAATWHPLVFQLKEKIKAITQIDFNCALLNLYRDGNDSNGWHADNEASLGINPPIASVSLGATRLFKMRHNHLPEKLDLLLTNGSLLLMLDETQHFWQHQLPKTKKIIPPRINITFRYIGL